MFEIEQKYRYSDWPRLIAQLTSVGATTDGPFEESDDYYNAPDRDFATTDEVFRIRHIGPETLLSYKGPKLPGAVKSRREIEAPLQGGHANAKLAQELVLALGYRPTATVRKVRQIYAVNWHSRVLQICLDEIEQLGKFVEVELLVEESERETARETIEEFASEFGLNVVEPRSYLRMVLEAAQAMAQAEFPTDG